MKRFMLLIIIYLVFCVDSYVLGEAQEIKEVDYRAVNSIYFHISKSVGSVNSYVVFLDNKGTHCATTGKITLSKA